MRWGLWGAVILSAGSTSAAAAPCYNLARGEPRELTGVLDYVVYPGPPNYTDVQRGDTPEPNYVLRLPAPICLTGDPDFADPRRAFRTVQVVGRQATWPLLKANLRRTVTLTLTDQMAAETGHHHEPLVAWVTALRPATTRPLSFTDEYGTAATTIRAFYSALHDGQGAAASALVVPEKRGLPAFSPSGLSSFYGSLSAPLQLLTISQRDGATFEVHYRYATKSRVCDGRAVVTTAVRGGRNFIQSIKALHGC